MILSTAIEILATVAFGGFILGMALKVGKATFRMGSKIFKDHDDD